MLFRAFAKGGCQNFFVPQIGRGVILFGEKCCFFCWLVFFFISFGMKL